MFSRTPDKSNKIISNKFFSVNLLPVFNAIEKDYFELDSFVVYHCIKGKVVIKTAENKDVVLKNGETVLIPAALKSVSIIPEEYSEILETYVEV